ncbi:MAG TPA: glycosyltransferase family 2 protein, partial [Minicystis sp.]|nr:glycosyltransferase family 2 protein [Minicystis sp.]
MNSPIQPPSLELEAQPSDTHVLDWLVRAAILAGIAAIAYVTVIQHVIAPMIEEAEASPWAVFVERPSILWAGMGTLLLLFRTLLWFRYRPFASATMEDAPTLTVVIPAYNEGAMVAQSIESVAAARYPRERLEIFVVDDGSTDDTWEHIQRAAARHPDIVTTLRFQKNRGKRAGLAAGFRRAQGDVVVTIDSDSVIEAGTLLALAGPFRDAKVGAVAGKVAVYNREEGVIPRMLHVRYALSFDLLRAVQSTYRTVYCCPGALTAYRRTVVADVLEAWLGQRFLGVPCTFGEDRSLTNHMLDRGFDTVYQRTAVVRTVVPTTYKRLCKMFIRWDRSYVREEIRFARIVWKLPLGRRIIALFDTTITNLRFPIAYASLALLVSFVVHDPLALLRVTVAIGVMSMFNMLYFLRHERSWAFVYG